MMKVIDLFAGCGGMSKGFQNAGFDIVAAFDNWETAIKVYQKNFLTHPIINFDLASLADFSLFQQFKPDMIIGGPPCQDFSSAGKRIESLGRADLTYSFASIICRVKPKWFVMENVDRICGTKTYLDARILFREAGYGLSEKILDASFCGVPQIRKRLFLIGEYKGKDHSLNYILEKNLTAKPITVRQYLGNALEIEHYYRHPRSYQRRAVFSIDEPSPTIRGVNRPIPPNYKFHSGDTSRNLTQIRPLTTKERSFIQTFPPDFVLEGGKADLEQMIGNAVPVKLAEYVANCIKEYCQKQSYSQLALFEPPAEYSLKK
jgi:DNA (cytosine-5)-methyltransferase 1